MSPDFWLEKAFLDFGITPKLFYLIPAIDNEKRYNLLSGDPNKALIYVSRYGILPLVEYFISKGANNYDQAMLAAVEGGQVGIVRLMADRGKKRNREDDQQDQVKRRRYL